MQLEKPSFKIAPTTWGNHKGRPQKYVVFTPFPPLVRFCSHLAYPPSSGRQQLRSFKQVLLNKFHANQASSYYQLISCGHNAIPMCNHTSDWTRRLPATRL